LAGDIAARCRSLKSVRLVESPSECESAYWFLFFTLDLDKLSVDKKTFVAALVAEGVPAEPTYLCLWTRAEWYRNRCVFGSSRYPWCAPEYKGDPDREFDLPNILAADAGHFRLPFHENLKAEDLDDLFAALEKVESAYST
jgi:dTDP-4-amino-4,6-dideoxygalactose transaminase